MGALTVFRLRRLELRCRAAAVRARVLGVATTQTFPSILEPAASRPVGARLALDVTGLDRTSGRPLPGDTGLGTKSRA